MPTPKNQVYQYVQWQITRLENGRDDSQGRAALAHLRRGIGHVPGEVPMLWGSFLAGLPAELHSPSGEPSFSEWAVYTALTLYALHQQGKDDSMQVKDVSLGDAARKLVGNDEKQQERIWRRLNLVAQAADILDMNYRLRQLVTLLKTAGIGLDYALLAADLYEYQFTPSANRVRLRWGQDFFRMNKNEEDNKNE